MLKYIATLGMLGTLAYVLYFTTRDVKPQAEQPRVLGLAFGPAAGGVVEMQFGVSDLMISQDPPKPNAGGTVNELEWDDQHFELRDSVGNKQAFQRFGNSQLVTGVEAGTANHFLSARLKPGEKYQFDLIPVIAQGRRYRHFFTAPAPAQREFERVEFQLVK